MIKTAEFIRLRALTRGEEEEDGISIEEEINQFIKENKIKDLIDIKYVKQIESDKKDLYILTSVLIIYKI